MPTIYNITFSTLWNNLLPVNKRKAIYKATGAVLLSPLQLLRDLFFDVYANGSTNSDWDVLTAYVVNDLVRYSDRGVYICILANTGNAPTDTTYWRKEQDIYIGLRERAYYNSQKIVMEYALNRWFMVAAPPADQIYITNLSNVNNSFIVGIDESESSAAYINSNESLDYVYDSFTPPGAAFTIFVPVAVYNALAATNTDRIAIVRSVANQWVLAGITYDVQSY